jgi:Na+/pantothenate symporter
MKGKIILGFVLALLGISGILASLILLCFRPMPIEAIEIESAFYYQIVPSILVGLLGLGLLASAFIFHKQ